MVETLGIHLSNPSVMAKITQLLKWLFSLRQGWRLAPHTPAECESWGQMAWGQRCSELPKTPHDREASQSCGCPADWPGSVLMNTLMGQAVGDIRKNRKKKHDSTFWVGVNFVLLFPIVRQPCAVSILLLDPHVLLKGKAMWNNSLSTGPAAQRAGSQL